MNLTSTSHRQNKKKMVENRGNVNLAKGNNFHDFLFASLANTASALPNWGLLSKERICSSWFTLKGKNLLLQEEQILSFKSKPLLRREKNL